MKKNLPLILFMLFCELAHGQFSIDNYPIDQFKLPEIDRQALEFSGNFFGSFDTQSNEEKKSYSASNINPLASLFYSRYINRSDLQALYSASFRPDFETSSFNNEFTDEKNTTNSFGPTLGYSAQQLHYRDQPFTLIGANGTIRYNHHYRSITTSADVDQSRFNSFEFTINLPLGIGSGRIETVSDMAMALFLLKDAIQVGTDPTLITPEQVNDFASRMVTLRNERVFDTRVKRMHELRELYNFMLENNWTVANDPGFFTVLTDNWLYNINPARFSGRRWTYGLTPKYRYVTSSGVVNGTPSGNVHSNRFGGELSVDFEKYKPVNVHHDIFRTHRIGMGVTRTVSSSELSSSSDNVISGEFTTAFGHQWIPNSRTRVSASVSGEYQYIRRNDLSAVDHLITLGLNGIANYFISYRTQLFANFDLNYNYDKNGFFASINSDPFQFEKFNTGFQVRLSAGATVSIF